MTDDHVDKLAELVGWSSDAPNSMNWPAIEAVVGRRLPTDFRKLTEIFPPGGFQKGLKVLHPAAFDSPEEYWRELIGYADMLRSEAEDNNFPFGVYPDQGGVLPWAIVNRDYILCWLTTDDDPDAWAIVVCDSHLMEWHVHDGPAAVFLTAVVTSPPTIPELSYLAEGQQPPIFTPHKPRGAAPPRQLTFDAEYWTTGPDVHVPVPPFDAVDRLRDTLNQPASGPTPHVDWHRIEAQLGLRLPADYKHLVDALGSISVGPARVAAPGDAATDLLSLINEVQQRVQRERAASGGPRGTYHPEEGGLLTWATIGNGALLCWAPIGPDPDRWPVVAVDASFQFSAVHPLSASAFLVALAAGDQGLMLPPDSSVSHRERGLA